MKLAHVIRHVHFEDVGNLKSVLERQGFFVDYVEAGHDDLADLNPCEAALLIILGGPIGAYEDDHYPFLCDELRLLERRLEADLPTLGICLGAQLMARALGARVFPGSTKEMGWGPITLTDSGHHSALRYLASDHTRVLHWHGDTFDMPAGATHLASTESYEHQAFSWGRSALALQFHPEVTGPGLERWLIGHAFEIAATPAASVTQLRQETQRYADNLQAQAGKVWQSWLDHVLMPIATGG